MSAHPAVIANIVDFESALSTAQLTMRGVGRLDSDGARGGPEALSNMSKIAGPFDLFDAWASHHKPRRAQIGRGHGTVPTHTAGEAAAAPATTPLTTAPNQQGSLSTSERVGRGPAPRTLPRTLPEQETGETLQLSDAGRGTSAGLNDLGSSRRRRTGPPPRRHPAPTLFFPTASPRRPRTWSVFFYTTDLPGLNLHGRERATWWLYERPLIPCGDCARPPLGGELLTGSDGVVLTCTGPRRDVRRTRKRASSLASAPIMRFGKMP